MRPEDVRNIVILRTDKIGDLILSTPAIRCVREAFPTAHITLVATPYNAPAVQHSPHLDEVMLFDPGWALSKKTHLAREIKSRRFDMALVLSPITSAYMLGFASGAPIRAGVVYSSRVLPRLFSPLLLTDAHIPKRGSQAPHEVVQMLDLLKQIGLPVSQHKLQVYMSGKDHDWAAAQLDFVNNGKPLIGLHLSSKWTNDGWSAEDLLDMTCKIMDSVPGSSIVATHGISDQITAKPFIDCLSRQETNVRILGNMEFGKWSAVFAKCDVVISPDTGALHLAAAAGKPVVALYSPVTFAQCSKQWAPWKVPHRTLVLNPAEAAIPEIVDSVRELLMAKDLIGKLPEAEKF